LILFRNQSAHAPLPLWPATSLDDLARAASGRRDDCFVTSASFPLKEALSKEELGRVYRRKKLFWESGEKIIPVNLPAAYPLRQRFSRLVLGLLPEGMEAYWNEQYFHGISPPYVLASEVAVLQFVATTPGAIGYVSAEWSMIACMFYSTAPHC
jgi:hypothetical protein